jgi:DnaJ-class molecular chaperone
VRTICETPSSPLTAADGEAPLVINTLLVLVIVVFGGGYLLSTYLHPFRPCRACKGSGVHRGSIYRGATRTCASCGGRGRFRRAGAPDQGGAYGERR